MHKEILTEGQVRLLPLVHHFSKNFFLVGGTAVALHIGHRRSIDFDLFSSQSFVGLSVKKQIARREKIERVLVQRVGECTMNIRGVKMTFFYYPFAIPLAHTFDGVIRMPDLLTLAAMKAYALGQRAKWKDYVDLYFIMKKYHAIEHIIERAKQIFSTEFNEKIFRVQLTYFHDVDYREKVEYMPGYAVPDKTIERALRDYSLAE